MFLPFDIPLVEKKTIHRRSKTVGVIENKSQSQFYNQKYSLKTQRNNSKSANAFKYFSHQKPNFKDNQQFVSMKKMTQKIQQLIHKELQYPQFVSSINRVLKRNVKHNSPEINNPQRKNQFSDDFTNKKIIQNQRKSVSREEEYLILIKNSQKFNPKSFIPHFNWKEKLTRLRNMGNYGHVYKKKPENASEHSILQVKKQQKDNQPINATKINLSNDGQIIQKIKQMKSSKKLKKCYTLNEQEFDQKQINLERYNKTCLTGQKVYSRKSESKTQNLYRSWSNDKKCGPRNDKDWNFGPWDVRG